MLHTPGHTEGSVCLYEERRALLLAGDVLFAGSYGRTDLPGGNDEQMVALARAPGARPLPAEHVAESCRGHGPETTDRARAALAAATAIGAAGTADRLRLIDVDIRHATASVCGYDRSACTEE